MKKVTKIEWELSDVKSGLCFRSNGGSYYWFVQLGYSHPGYEKFCLTGLEGNPFLFFSDSAVGFGYRDNGPPYYTKQEAVDYLNKRKCIPVDFTFTCQDIKL